MEAVLVELKSNAVLPSIFFFLFLPNPTDFLLTMLITNKGPFWLALAWRGSSLPWSGLSFVVWGFLEWWQCIVPALWVPGCLQSPQEDIRGVSPPFQPSYCGEFAHNSQPGQLWFPDGPRQEFGHSSNFLSDIQKLYKRLLKSKFFSHLNSL